nr:GtrA family protein [Paenibacillus ehimensis]
MNKEFVKFIISGLVNTLATYVVYLLFLNISTYTVSYSVSYFLGILLSYYLNSKFVFNERMSTKKLIRYPIVYISQYLINTIGLYLLVNFGISEKIAPIIIICITIPITFVLSKLIIKKKAEDLK